MGTEAAVQNQGSHRLTDKHRGQGLRNHESCDATVLTLMTSAALADRGGDMKRERKRVLPVQRDPSEGSFSAMLGLQRPLCVAIRQAAPSSHSGALLHGASTRFPLGPRGSLKAYKRLLQRQSHYQVDLESRHHKFKVIIMPGPELLYNCLKTECQMMWKWQNYI